MAAYAALVSLMNTVQQIQDHPRLSFSFDEKQIKSLVEIVGCLLDFIEGYSHGRSEEAEILESQIASAAHGAEDVIETHVVNQIHPRFTTRRSPLVDLQKVIVGMDSVKNKAMEVEGKRGFKGKEPIHSNPNPAGRPLTTGNNTMVGFDDELVEVMDRLTQELPQRLQIISIVGMGGIGKTKLAQTVYEQSLIVHYFHVRTWATVSQKYNVTDLLLQLLSVLKNNDTSENSIEVTVHELGDQLYKILCGKRYLIILDDIWSVEAWDEIKLFFPNSSHGSRIVLTTRQSKVAMHIGSSCLEKKFLDDNNSWRLFCEKAFDGERQCPRELMDTGKRIVERCQGLPLSIVVIGGLLRKSPASQEYWESVAEDIYSMLNSSGDDHCLSVLSLSYNSLPPHLKPCFLYMGIFLEDHEIRVSQLVKLWVSEGFLRQDKAHSLEKVAERYLSDLVERNLILVRSWRANGKIKTCYVHDLIRGLCLRVSEKEKFLREVRVFVFGQGIARERHIVLNGSIHISGSVFDQVNLRYFSCEHFPVANFNLPASVSLLWNVQTLILRGSCYRIHAPSEIWDLQQLRHLELDEIYLPDPHVRDQKDEFDIALPNLQTLLKVVNFKWSERACNNIPNITKLHVIYDDFSDRLHEYCLYNIGRLQKLESLNCSFGKLPDRDDVLHSLKLPSSLKKLCLTKCQLHWEDLKLIGWLPHLEVLKLGLGSVIGDEWNPVDGQFLRLKYLKIHYTNLKHWNVESSHFPVLESLVLDQFFELDEIPSSIGHIQTLKVISLDYCKGSAAISAIDILEEQESFGKEGLQVRVLLWPLQITELQSIRENLEQRDFKTNNFFVNC